ncbi:hypothetical protein B0J12DRAFT_321001 [Macrophomina phaseolina]|uniref:Uncharacterized protein n=1 Tax=Macrophomina phaseolina TaxID=35725 RepID=A0ABQ8FVW7_9PEZI|nr:hypothetical protein B0J12DRAFT_321001 [Macrophomina phaseolina]
MPASKDLFAILAPALVLAIRPDIPEPTPVVFPDPVEGFSPKVTGAAHVGDAAVELLRRYVDYDKTCGFVDANLASSLTCPGADICATNSVLGVAGCCNPLSLDSCVIFTSCVPSSQLASCTAPSCLLNEAVAKCTEATAPYCVDWKYDYITTTMSVYGCDVSAFTGTVEITYSGQDLYDISSYLTSIPEFSFPTVFVTQTQVISAGLSGSTSTSSSSSSSNNDGGSKTPIAAIVGGVVGGLAALAIVGAVLIFCLFKKRREKRNAAAAAAFTPAHQQQQQQPPPPPPPMGYGAPGPVPGYKPSPMQQQQPGNTASYYAPPPQHGAGDIKHEYVQQNVASVPSTPGPYSPPLSPSPQYTPSPVGVGGGAPQQHQRWDPNVPQIDGTPVHRNAEGQPLHEAP